MVLKLYLSKLLSTITYLFPQLNSIIDHLVVLINPMLIVILIVLVIISQQSHITLYTIINRRRVDKPNMPWEDCVTETTSYNDELYLDMFEDFHNNLSSYETQGGAELGTYEEVVSLIREYHIDKTVEITNLLKNPTEKLQVFRVSGFFDDDLPEPYLTFPHQDFKDMLENLALTPTFKNPFFNTKDIKLVGFDPIHYLDNLHNISLTEDYNDIGYVDFMPTINDNIAVEFEPIMFEPKYGFEYAELLFSEKLEELKKKSNKAYEKEKQKLSNFPDPFWSFDSNIGAKYAVDRIKYIKYKTPKQQNYKNDLVRDWLVFDDNITYQDVFTNKYPNLFRLKVKDSSIKFQKDQSYIFELSYNHFVPLNITPTRLALVKLLLNERRIALLEQYGTITDLEESGLLVFVLRVASIWPRFKPYPILTDLQPSSKKIYTFKRKKNLNDGLVLTETAERAIYDNFFILLGAIDVSKVWEATYREGVHAPLLYDEAFGLEEMFAFDSTILPLLFKSEDDRFMYPEIIKDIQFTDPFHIQAYEPDKTLPLFEYEYIVDVEDISEVEDYDLSPDTLSTFFICCVIFVFYTHLVTLFVIVVIIIYLLPRNNSHQITNYTDFGYYSINKNFKQSYINEINEDFYFTNNHAVIRAALPLDDTPLGELINNYDYILSDALVEEDSDETNLVTLEDIDEDFDFEDRILEDDDLFHHHDQGVDFSGQEMGTPLWKELADRIRYEDEIDYTSIWFRRYMIHETGHWFEEDEFTAFGEDYYDYRADPLHVSGFLISEGEEEDLNEDAYGYEQNEDARR